MTSYRKLWCSSTDYSNATDAFNLEIASLIAHFWMDICGIPKGLRALVRELFKPRIIEFRGTGPLASIGELVRDDIRSIRT
jgi:hypothetical protein